MTRFYSCCGAERSWTRNSHRDSCPYVVAASLKEHPANQDNLRRERHRRALKHAAESKRSGVFETRHKVIPLTARDDRCPAHPTEPADTCIVCADLEVDA